jgi:hypothetical protein
MRPPQAWLTAYVEHSRQLEEPHSYRIYEEPEELRIILNLGHDGVQPASADQRTFAERLRVAVIDDRDESVDVEIEGTFWWTAIRPRTQLDPGEPIVLASPSSIDWKLQVRRADGQRFRAGRHAIIVSTAESFATLRLADGSRTGAAVSERRLTIETGLPTNLRERSQMHWVAAERAYEQGRFADVVAAARQAFDAHPHSGGSYILGMSFLRLGKCREAAAALEGLLQVGLIARSSIPEFLAYAYVCANDESNARRVLRRRGFAAAQLDAEIARFRQLARTGWWSRR